MSPSDALYRAVCAAPHDDLPRLVYADWLEENGRGERAEFIRVQCRLANASPADEDYVDLLEREAELKAILWRELDADRPALPSGIGWEPEHRGFAERLRFGHMLQPDAVTRLEGRSAGVPIGGLQLGRLTGQAVDLLLGAYRHTLTSVEFTLGTGAERPSPGVDAIASGALPNLRRLLVDAYGSTEGLGPLDTSDALRNLRTVALPDLTHGQTTGQFSWSGSVETLRIQSGVSLFRDDLPNLHTLSVGRFDRSDAQSICTPGALPRLAGVTTWGGEWPTLFSRRNRPLAELHAHFPKLPRKAEDFFRQEWVEGLRILEPRGGPEQVRAALLSPRLTGLRQLRLRPGDYPWLTGDFTDAVWWASLTTFDAGSQRLVFSKRDWLATGLQAPNLKCLNLMGTPLGDDGAVALAENASLANLTRLNLSACRMGPRGVEALLNSPHLQRLIELNLYANQGGEALAPLADPGVMPNLGLADVAANGVSDDLRSRLEHRPAIRAR